MSTLFTKIINGEIPSYKIHEDEWTYSFLALDQVNLGHTLVVPKQEANSFMDCDEPYYSAVFRNAKTLSVAIKKATGCPRVGTIIAGFEVPHFHYHLIPAWSIPDLSFSRAKRMSEDEMKRIQKLIIENLSN